MVDWSQRQDNRVTDDGRDPFERDYARVVHSASFRRLQSKTQVLGLGDSDFYRTRLTHSLEVSQIGEGIVRHLKAKHGDDPVGPHLPGSSLIRAVCLAHDLGHPPFGHGGEVALNRCMRPWGGFEGNGQTLRIVARLEAYHPLHGMNLTRRTLLGVLKYPAPYGAVVDEGVYPGAGGGSLASTFKAKPFEPPKCYLNSETDVVDWLCAEFSADDRRLFATHEARLGKHRKTSHKTLDASIMELADDIAYGVHDLEDAIALKLIDRHAFAAAVPEATLRPFAGWKDGIAHGALVDGLFGDAAHLRKKAIGALVDYCVRSVEVDAGGGGSFEEPALRHGASLPVPVELLRKSLQELVKRRVIDLPNVQHLEFKGQKVVTELFEAFRTDPERLLLQGDRERFDSACDEAGRMRVICDYIAGMTDEYATKRYQQLFSPRVGSVFDRL